MHLYVLLSASTLGVAVKIASLVGVAVVAEEEFRPNPKNAAARKRIMNTMLTVFFSVFFIPHLGV